MWWDKHFNLSEHGDPYEKLWWPRLLEHEFPEYEQFWISHVVPLTNRIDPTISPADRQWIAIRNDSKLDEYLEQMAMAQYSTFYYFSRASLIILFEPHVYIEDTVLFLDLSRDNLKTFVSASKQVCQQLRVECKNLRAEDVDDDNSMKALRLYRNAFAHTPRLARAHHVPEGYIPKWQNIPVNAKNRVARHSWRSMQSLSEENFVEPRATFRDLRQALLQHMKRIWRTVDEGLNTNRNSKFYRRLYNLDENWCIPGKRHELSASS